MPLSRSVIIDDFRQQYSGTYVRFKENNKVLLIEEVGRDSFSYFDNKKAHKEFTYPDTNFEFSDFLNLETPDPGLYPWENKVIYLRRKAARQWSKGLSANNHLISYIGQIHPEPRFSIPLAEVLYTYDLAQNKQVDVEKAIKSLDAKQINAILDEKFTAALSIDDKVWLFMNNTPIATMENFQNIQLLSNKFYQEVQDLFNSHNINFMIREKK